MTIPVGTELECQIEFERLYRSFLRAETRGGAAAIEAAYAHWRGILGGRAYMLKVQALRAAERGICQERTLARRGR